MTSNKIARIAGFIYLGVILTGIFNLAYVPSKLIVWDDPATTFNNIAGSEFLFRLGIVSGLICYTFYLLLPLVLYKLLKEVNKNVALLMVALAVVSVPISFINIHYKVDILTLIGNLDYLKEIDENLLNTKVMLNLKYYDNGIQMVQLFWGLWLFPFGYLVYKSNFLPKILGLLLMIGCFGYLIIFFGGFLFPNYRIPSFVSLPASLGEIGMCLWLLIMGAKKGIKKVEKNATTSF